MPVCEHRVPVKFSCWHCETNKEKNERCFDNTKANALEIQELKIKVKDHRIFIDNLDEKVSDLEESVDALERRADIMADKLVTIERVFSNVKRIESDAQIALDLFIRKSHDLKKIDAKRDDILNLMNQKIASLETKIREIENANTRR